MNADTPGGIPLQRIAAIFEAERESYVSLHPRSLALAGHGIAGFYQGVPMHWMRDWSMPFPFLVESAQRRGCCPTSTATSTPTSASATPARCSGTRRRQ